MAEGVALFEALAEATGFACGAEDCEQPVRVTSAVSTKSNGAITKTNLFIITPSSISGHFSFVVAGAGFEPTTSGL